MPLLNVRLSAEDARRAAALRESGVRVSDIVREAIRAEYEKRRLMRGRKRRPSEIAADIFARFPDPPEMADEPRIDATERHAMRRYIVDKIRRRRA